MEKDIPSGKSLGLLAGGGADMVDGGVMRSFANSRMFLIFLKSFGLILACLLLLGGAGAWWAVGWFQGGNTLTEDKEFLVPRGESVRGIARGLAEESLISDERLFLFVLSARLTGTQGALKAGEYRIPAGASPARILDILRAGEGMTRAVTVPEGWTSHEIVSLIASIPYLDGEIGDVPPEGSLLPETYHYVRGQSRQSILDRMQADRDKVLASLWAARAEDLPFETPEEAVVLASIVEKETGVPSERARIAGVFVNRLKRGMKLQSDPTVLYALTQGRPEGAGQGPIGRRLLRRDLQIDSPYNTYRYAGLPPAPIAHAGRDSLSAVLNPEEHDYLYFVADGTGGHAFGRTLAEHNRNVAHWRRVRAGQNP